MIIMDVFLMLELKIELKRIVDIIVIFGKGILVVDESIGIMGKCFVGIGVENVEENCCLYC